MNVQVAVSLQITDGYRLHTKSRPPLCHVHCDQAGMEEWNSAHTVCQVWCSAYKSLKASAAYSRAGHCKQTVQGPSKTLHTCPGFRAVSHTTQFTEGDQVHWAVPCRLVSALTEGYYTSFWGPQSPGMKEYQYTFSIYRSDTDNSR